MLHTEVIAELAIIAAELKISDLATERAGADFDIGAFKVEAIFHIDYQGAAQAVEAIQRVRATAESNLVDR